MSSRSAPGACESDSARNDRPPPPSAAPASRGSPAAPAVPRPGSEWGDVASALHLVPTGVVVIALVPTPMVGRFLRGRRPLQPRSVHGGREPFPGVAIGPRHHHRDGHAVPRGQHTARGPARATVRGIGARGLSPQGAWGMAPSTRCQVHSRPFSSSSTVKASVHSRAKPPALPHGVT